MTDNILELVTISRIEGIGPKKLHYLIQASQNKQSYWQIGSREVERILGSKLAELFFQTKNNYDPKKEKDLLDQAECQVITYDDPIYPELLNQIYDPPPLLFFRGNQNLLTSQERKLAVVGSRAISSYGRLALEKLIPDFVKARIEIVSGLALGIDALAHAETVKSNGSTIAVLACGLDTFYPLENYRLAQDILSHNGLIISEFAPGTPPLKTHFPRRNRIIAGFSHGVLIVEAAIKSGSLITAEFALEDNRDLFAIPGDIFRKNSQGANNLIKNGGQIILKSDDLLDFWQMEKKSAYATIDLNKVSQTQTTMLKLFSGESIHIEELALKAKMTAEQTASLISQLELIGAIESIGGGYYRRVS